MVPRHMWGTTYTHKIKKAKCKKKVKGLLYVSVYFCVYLCRPEEGMDSLELKLRAVVSYLIWVPGIEFSISAQAVCTFH